jgi:hypothetical protein
MTLQKPRTGRKMFRQILIIASKNSRCEYISDIQAICHTSQLFVDCWNSEAVVTSSRCLLFLSRSLLEKKKYFPRSRHISGIKENIFYNKNMRSWAEYSFPFKTFQDNDSNISLDSLCALMVTFVSMILQTK